ncbi:MAG: DHH family phosphoesterase [Alphaproteobacteria bacterium]|nr:DHH family phosphoesterase [Alphaproteobacteria bacterium]
MMKKIDVLIEKIKKAKSIAIAGHKNPDGDSICSALALMKIIELNFNKTATVIYDGNIPRDLDRIPLRKRAHYYARLPENSVFDLVILVDYGTKAHFGGIEKYVSAADFVIEFDHHFNDDVVGNLCFDNPEKASTSQVIYDVVRAAKFDVDSEIIDLLTMAIITDTGNFKFVKRSDVLRTTANLVDKGANITKLVNLLQNKDKKTVLVETEAVSKAEFLMKGRLAIASIRRDDYKKLDGRGELVLGLLGQIVGVEFVVLLKEQKENQIGISIRSKDVPINHIAESFGGGGHLCAAGAVVMDSFDNVHTNIIKAFKGM